MLAELNIVGIIIAIVVAIIASLVKKKQPDDEWELPPELKPRREPPPQSSPPPKVSRWEEELRRVLQQQQPAPPPIVRPAVPPPLVQVQEYQTSPDEGFSEEPVAPRLHTFSEATHHYAHASSLLERTQEQLHQLHSTTHRAAAPASVHHVEVAPEVRELLKTLRQPQGVRSAIIASVILGPPRALET
jgi:hypothetical protein